MILTIDKKINQNSSIILNEYSRVIDFSRAHKMPYELITAKLNIPGANSEKYNNWYSIDGESYYFKNRTYLQNILSELLGVYLSHYLGLESVEYDLTVLNGKLIGLLSKNFRDSNKTYLYPDKLKKIDRIRIAHLITSKTSNINRKYQEQIYNYIMKLYYSAMYDRTINVLCEKKKNLILLSTLFDHEASFVYSDENNIYDPYLDFYINGTTINAILENHLLMQKSIDKIMAFDIMDALNFIECAYVITIPDEVKALYQEFDIARKEFMDEKIYGKRLI